MNPVPWLQMTNMISYQGLVRTFPKPTIKIDQFEITYDNYLDNCKHSNKLPASFEEYVDIKLQDHRDKLD